MRIGDYWRRLMTKNGASMSIDHMKKVNVTFADRFVTIKRICNFI